MKVFVAGASGALGVQAGHRAVFGYFAHAASGGQRDFSSQNALVAGRYDVMVSSQHLESAQRLMGTA